MHDSVHNSLGDRTVILRIRIDSLVPAIRLELCEENRCSVMRQSLDNFKQVVRLLRSQTPDQPFIKNQQIHIPVRLDRFLKFAVRPGISQFIQKLWYPDITHGQELLACSFSECIGDIYSSGKTYAWYLNG